MIYVTADLHGYPLDKFKALLNKAGFGEDDYLFVLGDVIDRGFDGISILRWMMCQPNVELIIGNHEAMMLSNKFLIEEVTELSIYSLKYNNIVLLNNWICNGGNPTLEALKILRNKEREYIFEYIEDCSLYAEIDVNGRHFILTHSGFDNFSPEKKFDEYTSDELLWCRPDINQKYFSDAITVFGHTPTLHYGEEYKGRMLKTDTWIDIDTGAAFNLAPMILRLDDMKEFYVDE